MATLYDELGISRTASPEEIKAAYRQRARATHPDAGGCREEFQRVQRAWEVLGDPSARARYDAHGDASDDPCVPPSSEILTSAFGEVVDGDWSGFPQFVDVISRTDQVLAAAVADFRKQLGQLRADLKYLRGILGRLVRTGGEPLLESALQLRIDPLVCKEVQHTLMLDRLAAARRILQDYRYRKKAEASDRELPVEFAALDRPVRKRRKAA